jgi:hypothetical protein
MAMQKYYTRQVLLENSLKNLPNGKSSKNSSFYSKVTSFKIEGAQRTYSATH